MKIREDTRRVRVVARCGVEGCMEEFSVDTNWVKWARLPPNGKYIDRPDGWEKVYFRGYMDHEVKRYVDGVETIVCPAHAVVFQTYRDVLNAWEQRDRSTRKTWWLAFKERFFPSESEPRPVPPWESE